MEPDVLLIDSFYGGSHRRLTDLLQAMLADRCHLITMKAKKWHWRARTGALWLSKAVPRDLRLTENGCVFQFMKEVNRFRFLYTSSVTSLGELVALRPDLNGLRKIVYFHENQLAYPVQETKSRDFQYGYNQILSCLVADEVLFNSNYNMTSFLDSLDGFMNIPPDYRVKGLREDIRPKCRVCHFPIDLPAIDTAKRKVGGWSESVDICVSGEDHGKEVVVVDMGNDAMEVKNVAGETDCSQGKTGPLTNDYSARRGVSKPGSMADSVSGICETFAEVKGDLRVKRGDDHDGCISRAVGIVEDPAVSGFATADPPIVDATFQSFDVQAVEDTVDVNNAVNSSTEVDDAANGKLVIIRTDNTDSETIAGTASNLASAVLHVAFSGGVASEPRTDHRPRRVRRTDEPADRQVLKIVWPHRWEHDKDPEAFFRVLRLLKSGGSSFVVSVLGEMFDEVPAVFVEAAAEFKDYIRHFGYVASKTDYYDILSQSDVVVSTAKHEFYGVAMLEAAYCGCKPLCPNRLAYKEIFPKNCLYNTENQLYKKLRDMCHRPDLVRPADMDFKKYSWGHLKNSYSRLFDLSENRTVD